jgi:hypothetical protein
MLGVPHSWRVCPQAYVFPSRLCVGVRILRICVFLRTVGLLLSGCRCGQCSSSGCAAVAGPAADVHIVPRFCVPWFCSLTCWISTRVRVAGCAWAVLAPAALNWRGTACKHACCMVCYGVRESFCGRWSMQAGRGTPSGCMVNAQPSACGWLLAA